MHLLLQKESLPGNCRLIPILALTLLIVALGLFPEPVFQLAQKAAHQILAPAEYIGVVFGGGS